LSQAGQLVDRQADALHAGDDLKDFQERKVDQWFLRNRWCIVYSPLQWNNDVYQTSVFQSMIIWTWLTLVNRQAPAHL